MWRGRSSFLWATILGVAHTWPTPSPGTELVHDLNLVWRAPAGCPQEPEVRREIARMLVNSSRVTHHVEAHGSVERLRRGANDRYVLSLTVERDGEKGERRLEASSCAPLGELAAVVVALAIDPKAQVTTAPPSVASAAPAAPGASAPAAPAAPAVVSVSAAPAAPAVVSVSAAPEEVVAPGVTRGRAGVSSRSKAPLHDTTLPPWHWALGPEFGVLAHVVPNVAVGVGGRVALRRGPFSLEASGLVLPRATAVVNQGGVDSSGDGEGSANNGAAATQGTGAVGGTFWWAAFGLQTCATWRWSVRWSVMDVGPCLGGHLGRLGGRGTGATVGEPVDGASTWGSLHGVLRLAWPLSPHVRMRVDVGAAVPLLRSEFVIEGYPTSRFVHRPAAVAPMALLGVDWVL